MTLVLPKFEAGATVRHAASGLGVIQRLIGTDRALVKFVAPTAEGDVEDIVLLEDLEFADLQSATTPQPQVVAVEIKKEKSAASKDDPAAAGLKYGIPLTPLRGKAPFLQNWQNTASTDPAQIEKWKQIPGVTGFGGVAKAQIGGRWALETDSTEVAKRYKADTGESLPNDVLITKSRSGGHRWFEHSEESIAMGNISQADVVGEDFSVRAHNEQCVMPGSLHPSGILYKLANDAPPKPAPVKLIAWLIKQKKSALVSKTSSPQVEKVIAEGGRNSYLTSRAGALRRAGLEQVEIESVLLRENSETCIPPLPENEVLIIARSVSRYDKGPLGPTTLIGGIEPGTQETAVVQKVQSVAEIIENLPKESEIITAQIEDMPDDVLIGRLGEAVQQRMHAFPVAYAWLSLVVHAAQFVPINPLSGLRTNLYFVPVGVPHTGKSMATVYSQGLLSMEPNVHPMMDVMTGSAEGLIKLIGDSDGKARLVNPDELGFLLERSSLEGASFPYVLNTAFYKTVFSLTSGGGKKTDFNCRLSVIGGISLGSEGDYEAFGDLYGSKTVGGLYDRSLFGLCPSGFEYEYLPFSGGPAPFASDIQHLKSVSVDQEVWEAKNHWVKQHKLNPRTTESAIRVAGICASYDGRTTIKVRDIEKSVLALSKYESRLQLVLKPNTGKNDDGILVNKFMSYLQRNASSGEWLSERTMLRDTRAYDLGTRALRVLDSLEYAGEIERVNANSKSGRAKRLLRLVASREN